MGKYETRRFALVDGLDVDRGLLQSLHRGRILGLANQGLGVRLQLHIELGHRPLVTPVV